MKVTIDMLNIARAVILGGKSYRKVGHSCSSEKKFWFGHKCLTPAQVRYRVHAVIEKIFNYNKAFNYSMVELRCCPKAAAYAFNAYELNNNLSRRSKQ